MDEGCGWRVYLWVPNNGENGGTGMAGSQPSAATMERAAVRMLTPALMAERSSLRVVQQQTLVPRPIAGLSSIRERLQILCAIPTLAAILVMPLAGFLFAGLFLGELVGALLGIYFAGLNAIFAWSRLPILARSVSVASCSDHATMPFRLANDVADVHEIRQESQRPAVLAGCTPQQQARC